MCHGVTPDSVAPNNLGLLTLQFLFLSAEITGACCHGWLMRYWQLNLGSSSGRQTLYQQSYISSPNLCLYKEYFTGTEAYPLGYGLAMAALITGMINCLGAHDLDKYFST